MGWWSSLKKAVKKIVRVAKALGRIGIRLGIIAVTSFTKIYDLVFGWTGWPPKKMRVQILILKRAGTAMVADKNLLWPFIDQVTKLWKANANVSVTPYSSGNKDPLDNWLQTLDDNAPEAALHARCGASAVSDEFGEAGDYFNDKLAGWVSGIPITTYFPVTVFIVDEIDGTLGCSSNALTDYITIAKDTILIPAPEGQTTDITIAHELGHACYLSEWNTKNNMMYPDSSAIPPHRLNWFQRNLARSSRHVTFF